MITEQHFEAHQAKMRELISIITPVFNESENLSEYRRQITEVIEGLPNYDFEIVVTDNSSSDDTFTRLQAWSKEDSRVRAFRFSRNFGYQRSIFTGYCLCRGAAAIEIDADLQDPPALLSKFLEARKSGHLIVYGTRETRADGYWMTLGRKAYYRILRSVSEDDLPLDAGDFMLIDRAVIDQLKRIYDPRIYIRGVIFSMGFRRCSIPYNRLARHRGASKFPFRKVAGLAFDGIIGQSTVPLRVATYTGLVIALCTFLLSLLYIVLRLTTGIQAPLGFTTLVVLILLSASMNALFLGIIGEYIARTYQLIRGRPFTIIEEATEASFVASVIGPSGVL